MYLNKYNLTITITIDILEPYPPVIKHGKLEILRTQWKFKARKFTSFYGPFSSTPCLITGG